MTLTTRCPGCATAFRVQPGQLSARGGKVRCGRCAMVFDGLANLVEDKPAPEQPASEPGPQLALQATSHRPLSRAALAAANEELAKPAFLRAKEPPPRPLLWGSGALLALLGLALQGTLYLRTEIAVLLPEAREPLAAACKRLGCELRLPRRPELMAIESSDLRADTRRDSVIQLNAVIRNRAPFAQEFPALELSLTDERDQPVVRRVLAPADYLPAAAAARASQGIVPGGEAVLRVDFDNSRIAAVGYRLYLFFP
ncbi:MAG: DUF3426 domain-containing protein [Betaproteobacteria bacterium]|nr:DUF3426 domain-containing protein [Betaproteobacteria bacterium]